MQLFNLLRTFNEEERQRKRFLNSSINSIKFISLFCCSVVGAKTVETKVFVVVEPCEGPIDFVSVLFVGG